MNLSRDCMSENWETLYETSFSTSFKPFFFFFENDVQSEWYVHRPYVSGRLYTTQTEQFLAAEAAGTFNAAGQDGNSNDGAEANCAAVRVGLGSN